MNAREAQVIVEEFYAFAVSRKIRGEGRFAIHADTCSAERIGTGDTRALAWKDAARRALLLAKERMSKEGGLMTAAERKARGRKPTEASARQMLNWICRTIPRLTYNSGDGSISIHAGKGWATAESSDPRCVEKALRLARRRDIKERAALRRDKRDKVWPYDRDQWDRMWSAASSLPATPATGE